MCRENPVALFRSMVVVISGLLLAVPASCAWSQDAGRVRLGQISLSFYSVTGAVVQAVLERLGHTVEITEGSHGQIFPKLGAGEVDLLVAAWLPYGHAVYWEQYGPKAEALAVLYEGARFEWMVPRYVPESDVASVSDLRQPQVQARMDKTIQGTGRDSANMMLSAEVIKAYALEEAGYRLQPGTLAEFHGAYDRNLAQGRWFVMPLWRPHYINRIGSMRPIEEPRGLLGPPSNGTLVAGRQWVGQAPPRTLQVLRRLYLGLDAVEQMDYLVNVEKQPPREAARAWMQQHAGLVEGWFAP
jgi:glycine betaine/proline transport system substrate-binding protein